MRWGGGGLAERVRRERHGLIEKVVNMSQDHLMHVYKIMYGLASGHGLNKMNDEYHTHVHLPT